MDGGRLLVRLNDRYRGKIDRYRIVEITNNNNQKSLKVVILGHDSQDAIFMPYDIRTKLGVLKGGELDFDIKSVGLCGSLLWYLSAPDPAVRIPAELTLIGVVLGFLGVLLGAISLYK